MDETSLKALRNWFCKNAAELPWRPLDLNAKRDPYAVWISETMLQQTQVSTVEDYFTRWMKRFPDIATLAQASEEEVFQYWKGLGYYSRARNILKTAQTVKTGLPQTRKELEALPGIGAYTAGAILSLAFHQKEAILDGNLVRIFSRYFLLDFLPEGKMNSDIYWNHSRLVANSTKAYLHNEALMELGRRVCKVKNPDCGNCPLKKGCKAYGENFTEKYPPSKKRQQKEWHGTVLIVESRDGKILALQGGLKFFKNQMSLPHFESPQGAAIGIPFQAEEFINGDSVLHVTKVGSFRHNITVHKMSCDVLYVKLEDSSKKFYSFVQNNSRTVQNKTVYSWIEKQKVRDNFASSFCQKALEIAGL